MPELPEITALAAFLDAELAGRTVSELSLASFTVLKTFDPPPTALSGATIESTGRVGKYLTISCGEFSLVAHLSLGGWLVWHKTLPDDASGLAKPGRAGRGKGSAVAARLRVAASDDQPTCGIDFTEAGTAKRLAIWIVRDPSEIDLVATLGPDALDVASDANRWADLFAAHRQQVKGLLRDQRALAGIGNAYSDEILHAAKCSPFAIAAKMTPEQVEAVRFATLDVLAKATTAMTGAPPSGIKKIKHDAYAVHACEGKPCPVCGDIVRSVSFASRSLEYCATCQTGGKPLADRTTSKFVK